MCSTLLVFHVTRDIREERRQGRLGYRPFYYTHGENSFVMSIIILRLTQKRYKIVISSSSAEMMKCVVGCWRYPANIEVRYLSSDEKEKRDKKF